MKRNKFNLSYKNLLSCNMGSLVPIGLTEVLPGDSVLHATSALLRCAPMLAPPMHTVYVRIHHWFVPHRLVLDEFEDFITGGPDGNNATVWPTMLTGAGGVGVKTLEDYYGIPNNANNLAFSALPIRGYAMIWNEFYRDQDLQAKLTIDLTAGADTTTSRAMQNVCWPKDYFTTARPWELKGNAVTVPIGGSAPVYGIGKHNQEFPLVNQAVYDSFGAYVFASAAEIDPSAPDDRVYLEERGTSGLHNVRADLTAATGVDVNMLREALSIQRYQENRARYGSRYADYLEYLGVRAQDARLQRPEYLGGGRNAIQFSEVLQTAEGDNPVGTMAGHGISAMRSNRYRRFIPEHGYIHTLLSVIPEAVYMDSLERTWNRRTKYDFHQRELEHIGQQEVLNKEVYAPHATPDGVFGFQNRYDDYRRRFSQVHGEFRTILDHWHFARNFSSAPALNGDFVKAVPTEEPFAAQDNDVLYLMVNHHMVARRALSAVANSYIY